MIKIKATHNLNRLEDQIGNAHNNLQEFLVRTMTDSIEQVKSELLINFGGAINYANFNVSYDGERFSLTISDLNEFVLFNESNSTAQDVLDYATSLISNNISNELSKLKVLG